MKSGSHTFRRKTGLIFICFQLRTVLGKGATKGAELAGMVAGKSDRTALEWCMQFFANNGSQRASKGGTDY